MGGSFDGFYTFVEVQLAYSSPIDDRARARVCMCVCVTITQENLYIIATLGFLQRLILNFHYVCIYKTKIWQK